MKKVLIFGCNGFVGHYLAEEFYNNGYEVIGSDCVECSGDLKKYITRYYKVELNNYTEVYNLVSITLPDYIINLAAISSVGDSWNIPQKTVEVNLIGTINILESVKKLNINTKIMLVGSSEEYATSTERMGEEYPIVANNPYGLSKVAQEHFSELYREEYGLKIVNTRTFNHTGYGQPEKFAIPSFVRQVAEIHNSGQPGCIKVGNLNVKRDLGDVRDMASAYRMILESDSTETVFNVGSGQCYNMHEILNYIISLSDQVIEIKVDEAKLRPIDNPVIWCDNTKIKKEIGWSPKYTVYDAIDRMFKQYTRGM